MRKEGKIERNKESRKERKIPVILLLVVKVVLLVVVFV